MTPASMDGLQIVDPHFHLWNLEENLYPWLGSRPLPVNIAGDVTPIARTYLLDDYLADQGRWKVSQAVHVDAGYDPRNPVGETRWLPSCNRPASSRFSPHTPSRLTFAVSATS